MAVFLLFLSVNTFLEYIAQIRPELPQDINEPIVQKLSFSGSPIIAYAVKSDVRSVENLSNYVDKYVIPRHI